MQAGEWESGRAAERVGFWADRLRQSGTKWKGMRRAAIWKTWRLSRPVHVPVYVCRSPLSACVRGGSESGESARAVEGEPLPERKRVPKPEEWESERASGVVGKNCNP